MRRVLLIAVALTVVAGAGAPPAAAGELVSCRTPQGFMTGPFYAGKVRARAVSCTFARRLVRRWGRTRECLFPSGPDDRDCSVGRYRCVYRRLGGEGSELSRATCKRRGTRRAVGFNFGV